MAVRGDQRNADGGRVEGTPEPLLALENGLIRPVQRGGAFLDATFERFIELEDLGLGPLPLGDVADDAGEHTADFPGGLR